MRIEQTPIPGAYLLYPEKLEDKRGYFMRTWCSQTLQEAGCHTGIVQCSTAMNLRAGTLRGMHFQRAPYEEEKYVTCLFGEVFDVIVDLREGLPSYLNWFGVRLSGEGRETLYVPKGCAHGYLTLVDRSEMFYQMTTPYHPQAAAGIRYDDPLVGIEWGIAGRTLILSDKDRNWPLLRQGRGSGER